MRKAILAKTLKIESTDDDSDNGIKIIDKINEGFSYEVVDDLVSNNKFTLQELIDLISSSNRTLYRRKEKGRLSSEESDALATLISLVELAEDVFDNEDKAYKWLRRPNRSLHSRKPIDLLKTAFGRNMVEGILNKIAYGLF